MNPGHFEAAQVERVLCHQCEATWLRSNHGLTCPHCGSEFVEILEGTDNVQQHQQQQPSTNSRSYADSISQLRSHNPWNSTPGPAFLNQSFMPQMTRQTSPHNDGQYQGLANPAYPPVAHDFFSMLSGMGGASHFQNRFMSDGNSPPVPNSTSASPFGPGVHSGYSSTITSDSPFNANNAQPRVGSNYPFSTSPNPSAFRSTMHTNHPHSQGNPRSFQYGSGNHERSSNTTSRRQMGGGVSFTISSTTSGPGGTRTYHYSSERGDERPALSDLIGTMFGGAAGNHPGWRSETTQTSGPETRGMGDVGGPFGLLSMFSQMLNPANARFGDAVYSQEALDRIMSQLMEEHQNGNAPGPASEAAIDALPRKPATMEQIGETGEAECSICMETVRVGVVITELPCHHWFHPDCAKMWLKEHDTCPICRAGITPQNGDPNQVRQPGQAPQNTQDPASMARHQSETQRHPFVVPESPAQQRRQPSQSRPAASLGAGISGRLRSFLGRDQQQHQNDDSNSYDPHNSTRSP